MKIKLKITPIIANELKVVLQKIDEFRTGTFPILGLLRCALAKEIKKHLINIFGKDFWSDVPLNVSDTALLCSTLYGMYKETRIPNTEFEIEFFNGYATVLNSDNNLIARLFINYSPNKAENAFFILDYEKLAHIIFTPLHKLAEEQNSHKK
jgi:hypothetical protein